MLRLSKTIIQKSLPNTLKRTQSTTPPPPTTPPTQEPRGFYKVLNVPENSDLKQIAEAYQDKCEVLSEKLSSSNESEMDEILEEIYLLDKAFKVWFLGVFGLSLLFFFRLMS